MPKNRKRFGGLLTNWDLKDIPPGYMVEQTNIGCYNPGRLDVRSGIVKLKDTWDLTVSGTDDVISTHAFISPQARWVVMEKTDGSIKAIRDGITLNSLVTGLNVFQPISACVDLYGSLIIVNGIERGYRWNGISSTPDSLGVDGPIHLWGAGDNATPSISPIYLPGTGNLRNDALYYCAYRYIDRDGIPSSISEIKEFRTEVGASGTKIEWDEDADGTANNGPQIKASTQSRVVSIELWRSVANAPQTLYKVTTLVNADWGGSDIYIDDVSDEELLDNDPDDIMDVFDQDGFPNARRFEPPPTDKPYVCLNQDVLLMYGRVFYNEGTLAATNGNATHTGTGVSLRSEMVGWRLRYDGETTEYEVATVNEGASTFTTTVVYAGSTGSGKTYTLSPDSHSAAYTLNFSVRGEPESMPSEYAQRIQASSALTDLETGLFAMGVYVYAFNERTHYQVSYGNNPALDMSISDARYRGAVNQRCIIAAEESGWAMDQLGFYKFGPSGYSDVTSDILRSYFKSQISWTAAKRKWYFASYDPHSRVLRFHVQFVGDSDTRPKRAVCYNALTGEIWDELYPIELSGSAIVDVDGLQRLVCGGPDDNAILFGEGTADLISTAIQGTITSAATATTSFVDSAASFPTTVVGVPVSIISGTGKGTTRTISTRTNGTTLVVDSAWTVGTDSVYVIGAIGWSLKTGAYEYVTARQEGMSAATNINRMLRLQHIPTSSDNFMTLRLYQNRSASALTRGVELTDANGFAEYKENGDVNIKLHGDRSLSSDGDPGFTNIALDSTIADSASCDRFLQVEIEGYQGPDVVAITALDMEGFD